uniref:Uncharacterized protein n=1 Tax=Octopus bimaculoides TaxID=37653 RepID=A0A0L8I7N4_OCTBM
MVKHQFTLPNMFTFKETAMYIIIIHIKNMSVGLLCLLYLMNVLSKCKHVYVCMYVCMHVCVCV